MGGELGCLFGITLVLVLMACIVIRELLQDHLDEPAQRPDPILQRMIDRERAGQDEFPWT